MKRSRPPRPRVKLNRDAVWELLDRLGMSWNEPGRRSCPDNGFAQLQEWTDGGSVLASPCGRTGQVPRQRIQHSRRTDDFPDDFPERLVRFREESWAELNRRLDPHPETVRRGRDKEGAAQRAAHVGAAGAGELAGP